MPRLTILIPCLGGAPEFDSTLVSVLQNRPRDCEVVVAHTAPYDDPYSLAGEVQFLHLPDETGLARLINRGCAAAQGEIVHIVGCGVEVEDRWTEPALAHFVDPDVAAVSPLLVQGDDRARAAAAGVVYRLAGIRRLAASQAKIAGTRLGRTRVSGPTLRSAFYRRDVLEAIGGFDEHLTDEFIDIDLALSLARLEQRVIFEPASRTLENQSTVEKPAATFARGRSAERLFYRHAKSRGLALSLLLHPWALLAEAGSLTSMLGRAWSLLEFGAAGAHERRLAAAQQRLREQHPVGAVVSLTVARAKAAHAAQDAAPQSRRKAA